MLVIYLVQQAIDSDSRHKNREENGTKGKNNEFIAKLYFIFPEHTFSPSENDRRP